MEPIETITEFLAWATLINIGLLLFSTIVLMLFRKPISAIHSKMFGLSEEDIYRAYFQYLAQYKIAIIIFNLVPYISLKIIA